MSVSFKDKVVVVTGAGGGLGKHYCIEFAKRGAKVVVNDLGGSLDGQGNNSKAADVVVEEIRSSGGTAVADYNNVLDGDKIIQTAVDNFGTVHVLINNAGILRDASFAKMSDKDFQLVIDVHLNGAYKATKAAWPYFVKQKYGRIINTASPAGLYGNFGQSNYSAAKLGLIGFAETLAKEGASKNILANAIAPLARSRMTEDILPPHILEKLNPSKIAPLVLYLTSEANSKVNGQIFEVAAGFYGQIRWERSSGVLFNPDKSFTAEAVASKFKEIFDFKNKSPVLKTQYPTMLNDYNALYDAAIKLPSTDNSKLPKISLKGKVVLITGSGAGLGRDYALWFARYGASVVVNDFKDPYTTVEQIKAQGGEAHADKHDVSKETDAIMENVINKYGRIDILVNNAGILRDKSFAKMTDEQWYQVQQIHLIATYKLCKLAWPHFVKQKSGRIINITSTSGIYGNFGQANYAAAKSGILGLSRTLAIEGAKRGIKTNIVAPHAETAMTLTIFGENEKNKFHPDQVAPLLIVLGSNELEVNGELFEVGGGWIGNTRWQRAKGFVSHDADVEPESIRDNWKDVIDFEHGVTIGSTTESSMAILDAIGGEDAEDDDDEDDDEEDDEDDEAEKKNERIWKYTEKDLVLYNLAVGATADELRYVYENDKDFTVVPTFVTTATFNAGPDVLDFSALLKDFNPMFLLHGENYTKIKRFPIPKAKTVETNFYPVQILDKGSSAIVVQGSDTTDLKTGEKLFYNETTIFVRNAKGESKKFKERTAFALNPFTAPTTPPDFVAKIKVSPEQAVLYRLTGDTNPLHVDNEFAKGAKFPKPILHGMCTFGMTAKKLLDEFGQFDEFKIRFTGIVFPGETLEVKAWKQNNGVVIFQTWVVERNSIAINNAAIHLLVDKSKL